MTPKQFLETLAAEESGFSFVRPWRMDEGSQGVIIPITRNAKDLTRGYMVLAEARDVKIEDTGSIDAVYVKNNEDVPVLISRGEIFRGKTQERAAIHDHLVAPGKGLRVAVRCVHARRGIQAGTDMKYGGRTPYDVTFETQGKTWDSVSNYAMSFTAHAGERVVPVTGSVTYSGSISSADERWRDGTATNGVQSDLLGYNGLAAEFEELARQRNVVRGSSAGAQGGRVNYSQENIPSAADETDLAGTLDDVVAAMKDAMKKIPAIDDQVGAAFFVGNTMKGLDIYDLPASWKALKDDVVAKEGSSFMKRNDDDMFEFKPEAGIRLLKKILGDGVQEKVIFAGPYILHSFENAGYIGEALEFNEGIIHLTMWEKPKQKK
jgi:hypothetical protein